ncbi:MAG: uroporphyrinogen decarboxylase [Chlamydiota bacterium]
MNTLLLDALKCKNYNRPPVWLMRQAGRYMPEYRLMRERYSLWDLFHTPELAAEVTLQPVNLLGVDAAILFSDILVVAEIFGLEVVFPEGQPPKVIPQISPSDVMLSGNVEETLHYVKKTIALLKPELKVPLIGFCGAPFTLATYFINGALEWMARDAQSFHRLLEKITEALIQYLLMQVAAGVQVIQIFDSWANLLTPQQFFEFSHAYLAKMVNALKAVHVPVILFCRGSSLYPKELSAIGPAAISFDSGSELYMLREHVPKHIAVQGNLDPEFLLTATASEVSVKTCALLQSMKKDPGFIANLGHGVLPGTPVDNVCAFIEAIKTFL